MILFYIFLAAALVFFALKMRSPRYIYSPLVTLSCAAAVLAGDGFGWAFAALVIAAVGDYFMAHKGRDTLIYTFGIAGFLISHIVFVMYALSERALGWYVGLIVCCALLAAFVPYMLLRALPKTPAPLRIPVMLYMLVSVAGLSCAVMTGSVLYALGVGTLVFSDVTIAENDFVGVCAAGKWILPSYYLSQMLAAAGVVLKL